MGFISSITRSVRNNKISRKLSISTSKPHHEDSKDLIKIPSNVPSLTRVDSLASTIRLDVQEATIPTESPAHRKRLTPADLNLQTLFDNAEALDPATSRAVRALSMPEYPILKMDTVKPPFDTPAKRLQDPIDTGRTNGKNIAHTTSSLRNTNGNWKSGRMRKEQSQGHSRSQSQSQTQNKSQSQSQSQSQKQTGSRIKRSMTGLLKKSTSLKIPRSSLSLKTMRGPAEPKWMDGRCISEEDFLVDERAELKWLELNGLSSRDTEFGVWRGNGFGRPW
ncbi:hypothetical protein N7478_007664 [Penicillium angulare]|uniref:uncharacterized protein n=1 Tax=Penicillium angulare TaxID=116970 RepID=UPI00254010A1|nr:uncharacterized protein N7478_007664 [Penicillium angulare]KAJ5272539.1 hypothetical protein N7478_007664 [Penicillium angulare]